MYSNEKITKILQIEGWVETNTYGNRLVSVSWYNSSFVYNMVQHYKLLVLGIFRVYGVYNLNVLMCHF